MSQTLRPPAKGRQSKYHDLRSSGETFVNIMKREGGEEEELEKKGKSQRKEREIEEQEKKIKNK